MLFTYHRMTNGLLIKSSCMEQLALYNNHSPLLNNKLFWSVSTSLLPLKNNKIVCTVTLDNKSKRYQCIRVALSQLGCHCC
jgi:hypothetical protein